MNEQERLHDLERQFVIGCRNWYLLRVWERHRSFESATIDERIRVAEEVLTTECCGSLFWAWGGWLKLIEHLICRLSDDDPHTRSEAAIALGHLKHGGRATPFFLQRVASSELSPHDRACAAWALGQLGRGHEEIGSVLLKVLIESAGLPDADELRRCAAEAIEQLTNDDDVLFAVARFCLGDSFYKCKLIGLGLFERLDDRRGELTVLVRRLVCDEFESVSAEARRIMSNLV